MNLDTQRALVLSKRDQIMEGFKEDIDIIDRISKEGPSMEGDVSLIKQCVHFVCGEVALSNAEQARTDK